MQRIRVGVVHGGASNEHDVSRETGKAMLKHLPEHYEPIDVLIERNGTWTIDGTPVRLDKLMDRIDVVLNGMHGEYGEDGQVQKELDQFGIPYTGSGAVASATAFNKHLTKELMARYGVKVANHIVLNKAGAHERNIREIFNMYPPPYVVKPVCAGSSVGASIADTLPELKEAIHDVFAKGFDLVMVEEYIKGREGTCGVVENFRGEDLYALPPIEIIPPEKSRFFSADVKYTGETQEICPGNFTREEKEIMQEAAKLVHSELGLSHYSRTDFIVSPRPDGRGEPRIYALEVNTLPGMTPESLMPKAVDAVGVSFSEFLDHLIKLAYRHA